MVDIYITHKRLDKDQESISHVKCYFLNSKKYFIISTGLVNSLVKTDQLVIKTAWVNDGKWTAGSDVHAYDDTFISTSPDRLEENNLRSLEDC